MTTGRGRFLMAPVSIRAPEPRPRWSRSTTRHESIGQQRWHWHLLPGRLLFVSDRSLTMDILRQKANTKRPGIVQAATSLFAARGIDGVSMRDIAQAAGVREAAIYRHFASKDELAREIFVSWYGWHCQQVHQIVTGAGGRKEQLRDIVGQEFTVAERYPEAFLYFCEYRGRCDLDSFSLRLRHLLSLSLLFPLWFWAKVHHTKRG